VKKLGSLHQFLAVNKLHVSHNCNCDIENKNPTMKRRQMTEVTPFDLGYVQRARCMVSNGFLPVGGGGDSQRCGPSGPMQGMGSYCGNLWLVRLGA
jgi:hypothetical protein